MKNLESSRLPGGIGRGNRENGSAICIHTPHDINGVLSLYIRYAKQRTIHHSQWSRFDPPFVVHCAPSCRRCCEYALGLGPTQFAALALLTCEQWANILHKDHVDALCKKKKNYSGNSRRFRYSIHK